MGPCFPGDREHLPVHGEWMNSLFHFAEGNSFCFPYWTGLISTPAHICPSHICPSDLVPHPAVKGVSKLLAGVKSQHWTELISSGIEACQNAGSCTCVQMDNWGFRQVDRHRGKFASKPAVLWQLCTNQWAVHWKGRRKRGRVEDGHV